MSREWAELYSALADVIQPLMTAGWRLTGDTDIEESPEFGASVSYELRRGAETVWAELYEDGQFVVYAGDEPEPADDAEPSPPLLSADSADSAAVMAALDAHGLLNPAG